MDIYSDYMPQLLLVAGLVLLVVEAAVLGFSTFILLFIGIGCLVASGLMYADIIQHSFLTAAITVAIVAAVSAGALWQPLKRLQQKTDDKPVQQDFIGHEFVLTWDIDNVTAGKHRYAGIEWEVLSVAPLSTGTRVKVNSLEVGKFFVEAC